MTRRWCRPIPMSVMKVIPRRSKKTCHVSLTLLNLLTKPKNSNYYYALEIVKTTFIPSSFTEPNLKQTKSKIFRQKFLVLSLWSTG
jgi:hypothetical protein